MAISSLDPVSILEQRVDFIQGITELASMCNWKEEDIDELRDYVSDQLIYIDNLLFQTYDETKNKDLAHKVWEAHMEDLRHGLSLILGVKIRYI